MPGDFTKTLFSPPVIIAGVAIGGLLLFMNAGSAPRSSGAAVPVGPSSAQLGAVVQINTAAMDTQVKLAQIAAQSGAATLNANVQEHASILSFLNNINNSNAITNNTLITSAAGITNASIAGQTAIALDVNNNQTRLGLAYVSAQTADNQAAAQVMTAQAQAKAATSIARTQAIGGIFNNLIAGSAKIATGGFG